jgi:hypothetical protein
MTPLERVRTIEDRTGGALRAVGSTWTRAAFDGPFFETPADGALSMGVVFVQSRDGNTATRNPGTLGGGSVDGHLIYEGLSRVAADAVVAGAATLHAGALFTVWRPELVELRLALNLPRHPAQVVMSADGSVRPDELLLFNVPHVPVYVLTSSAGRERLAAALEPRPWVEAVTGRSLPEQFARLRDAGIRRACSVGGRRSATRGGCGSGERWGDEDAGDGGEPGTLCIPEAQRVATVLVAEWAITAGAPGRNAWMGGEKASRTLWPRMPPAWCPRILPHQLG